jgi:hypothetical protein
MYLDSMAMSTRRRYVNQGLSPVWSDATEEQGLSQWVTIATTLLPIVLQSAPTVIGFFKKGKPTLTESQIGALQRLPDPYLGLAIAELEASSDMKNEFEDIYKKYVLKAAGEKKIKDATNAALLSKRITTVGLIAGGVVVALIATTIVTRS